MEEKNTERNELSKEEVLSRSRKEYKSGDEREQGRRLLSRNIGFVGTIFVCVVVLIVRVFTEDVLPCDIMAIIFTGLLVQNTAEMFFTANKTLRIVSIVAEAIFLAAAILYWVEWGMYLAG